MISEDVRFLSCQIDELMKFIDERAAMVINALDKGEHFEPCDQCDRFTCKPYRNHAEHGADFCSAECLDDFANNLLEENREEASDIAYKKYTGNDELLWDRLFNCYLDGSVKLGGIEVIGCSLTYEFDEEQIGGVEGHDGEWIKFHYAIADAENISECQCLKCNHQFETPTLSLMKKQIPKCPSCSS